MRSDGTSAGHDCVRTLDGMTSTISTDKATLLRRAAERARLAPSIHNTQPWRFVLRDDVLEIRADYERQLRVLDPRGRQLMISLGCALFNARTSIAAAGYEPIVRRFPDPDDPELVARVWVASQRYWPGASALNAAIDQRRTNRRAFLGEPIPSWLEPELHLAARTDEGYLFPITRPEQRAAVAQLSELANERELRDPAYRAEIAAWTTDNPRRLDGVQAASVPYHGSGADGYDPLPIRNFDARGMGWLPTSSRSDANQSLLLLCSADDRPRGWLRSGEALEHVWLKLTDRGFWASPLTQVIEVRETHARLKAELGLGIEPQMLLRVGRAPATVPTLRRPAGQVIVDGDDDA